MKNRMTSILFLSSLLMLFFMSIPPAFAVFDGLDDQHTVTISIGSFAFPTTLNFSQENLNDFDKIGNWNTSQDGFTSSFGFLYVPNPSNSYAVTVNAKLAPGNSGGFGVIIDGSIDEDNRLSGLVIQLDRGFAQGAIIVRQWDDGNEEGGAPLLRINAQDIPSVPTRNQDPDWWASERELTIVVTEMASGESTLTLFIDGVLIFDNFVFTSTTNANDRVTGLRSWGTTTTFYSLSID